MILYFAYGSNLNAQQIRERCPGSRLIDVGVLKNYKLGFTVFSTKRRCGCADILESNGDEVWGLIYELTPEDLTQMDGHEGHPTLYKRFTTFVEDREGVTYEVETYAVVEKHPVHLKPSPHYFGLIASAAEIHEFPSSYREFLHTFEIEA